MIFITAALALALFR